MSEGIELPPLAITESDQELSKALQLPSDLKPDSYNTGEWIVKMTVWMGSARVCRERQLRDALKRIAELESQQAADREEISQQKASKDIAYSERDRLVCAISKMFPSWLERHPDSDITWEDDWRWIVFVEFPTGQASWHIHDSELTWFDHLEKRSTNSWDGHSTAEKYARIERFNRIGELQSREESNPAAAEGGR